MNYQNLPITLTPCAINKKDPRYDVYIVTKDTNLEPSTVVSCEYKKVINDVPVPRTKVLVINEQKEILELCTFEGASIPPLDNCTLLFPFPIPNATKVDDTAGSSFTNQFVLAKDFDLIKFGTDYYSLPLSRIERAVRMRKKINKVHRMDVLDFQSSTKITETLGESGAAIFWAAFDQFFSQNPAETAAALLRQADPDEIRPNLDSIQESINKTNKRVKLTQ